MAVFCGLMALLIFGVSAFLIVDGVRATEPSSMARYTRIAQGVTFLLGGIMAFVVAGLFPRFEKIMFRFGVAIFIINSVLMSISMISNGMTAGKIAAQSAGVIATLEANNNTTLAQIGIVQQNAKKLSSSRHDWNQALASKDLKGVEKEKENLKKDSEKLIEARTQGAAVSTPMVEVIGEAGLYIVSGVLAVAMEALSGLMMYVMGSLLREASGAMTHEAQTLEMLRQIHAVSVGQPPAPVMSAPVSLDKPALAPAAPAPVSYGVKVMRSLGVLTGGAAAVAAPVAHSAPAAPAKPAPSAPACTPADADALMPAAPVAPAKPASAPAAPDAPKQVQPVAPKQVQEVQDDAPEVQAAAPVKRTRKAAPAPDSARADTGVVGDVAGRYTRAKDAVESRKCAPSQGGIRKFLFDAGEGCNQDVVIKYLAQMAKEDLIEPGPNGRSWKLKGVKS